MMNINTKISDLLINDQLLGSTQLDENTRKLLIENSSIVTFSKGELAAKPGLEVTHFALVIKGSFRVRFITGTGRDITLYHTRPGDVCALMMSCLLGGEPYPAECVAESEVVAMALPLAAFDYALEESKVFRRLVFKKYSQRLASVIARMEQLSSPDIDNRLACMLLELSNGEVQIKITHHELATEPNSSREVISRHLKQFESNGWIQLKRGKIDIKNIKALADICAE